MAECKQTEYKRELIPVIHLTRNGINLLECGYCNTTMSTKSLACGLCGMTTNVQTSTGGRFISLGCAGNVVNAFECGKCNITYGVDLTPKTCLFCGTLTNVLWRAGLLSEAD